MKHPYNFECVDGVPKALEQTVSFVVYVSDTRDMIQALSRRAKKENSGKSGGRGCEDDVRFVCDVLEEDLHGTSFPVQ